MLPAPKWDHEAKSMVTADGKRHVYYRISESRWETYDLTRTPTRRSRSPDRPKTLEQQLAAWIEGPLAQGGGK